jgi:hypothetical protein
LGNTANPVERASLVSVTLREPVPNHSNQLLDRVEELLVENSALDTALEVVKRFLPPEAREKVRSHIEDMKSDPTLRELVHRRFLQYRDQSLGSTFSQLLREDLKKGASGSSANSRHNPKD